MSENIIGGREILNAQEFMDFSPFPPSTLSIVDVGGNSLNFPKIRVVVKQIFTTMELSNTVIAFATYLFNSNRMGDVHILRDIFF